MLVNSKVTGPTADKKITQGNQNQNFKELQKEFVTGQ